MRVQSALIFDGVLLLAEAFKQLDMEQLRPKKLNCNNHTAWENGNSITNFMRNVSYTLLDSIPTKGNYHCNGPSYVRRLFKG